MHLVIRDVIQVPTHWHLVPFKTPQSMTPDSTCSSMQSPVSPKPHLLDLSRSFGTSYTVVDVDANSRMWENI